MNFEHDLEVFVREVIQNSLDARRPDGTPVRVVFDLRRLECGAKRAFLEAAGWAALRPHIAASRDSAPAFREALLRLDAPDVPLVILTIHDGPALGLSGDERGDGRFAMFARNKLLSEKESKDAGGSFGLGKSVLWAFSGISTVLVHSRPQNAEGLSGASRFIGIAQLPWHEAGGRECDGPGWFGERRMDGGVEWSSSFVPEPDSLDVLQLTRDAGLQTGTSICIPDFQCDEEPASVATALERAAAKWFWPALAGPQRSLEIEVRWSGGRRTVDPAQQSALRPFLHLAGLEVDPSWTPRTVHAPQPLKLPALRDTMRDDESFQFHDALDVDDAIRLDALQIEQDQGELSKSLALVRGARMVVRYVKLQSDQPAFALARAGTAHGERHTDRLVEQFLRHAEPPSHDDWAPHAPKLHDRYKRGYVTELKGLKKRLADAAVVLLRRRDNEHIQQEMPAALRKVMAVSLGATKGDGGREGRFDYRITDCRLIDSGADPGWEFSGWVQNTRGGSWVLEAEGWLEGDGGRILLPVTGLRIDGLFARSSDEGLRIDVEGRIGFAGFCPILALGDLAGRAVFGVQLRRKKAMDSTPAQNGRAGG